jgi:hypothetical protein
MKKIMGLYLAVGIIISSCNMPAAGSPDPQIATAAALTVQAVLDSESVAATPLASPTKSGSATATEVAPTFSQPLASVGEVTNCRSGPGKNYERVTQIFPGDSVKIIGFLSPNYWVVSTKDGKECWLSGEFATPVGSFAAVPTVTAPPTPEGGAPEAATFLKENGWTFDCSTPGQASITLSWNDKAEDETGYRILRNREIIAELPANSTFFAETIELLSGQNVAYQIRAYNLIGETDSAVATITCP